MQDRARFAHLDHERGLPPHQVVGCADAREETIHHADRRAAAGHERPDLREHHAEPDLAKQRGLAGHVGARKQDDATRCVERHVVGNERFAGHHPLDDRMAASLELQRELARHCRPHVALALGDVGQRGPGVETRQVARGRLDPRDHFPDPAP